MRSKLQYLYSISVFLGVLVTSYLMMSKDESARLPFQALQNQNQRVDASAGDPAVQSLMDIQNALRAFPRATPAAPATSDRRAPSFTKRTAE